MPCVASPPAPRALAIAALLTFAPPAHPAHPHPPPQDPAPAAINLVFTPEAPPPGSTVTVTYHPRETLAGEPELILRGHFRAGPEDDLAPAPRNERIATLAPGDGDFFTASFRLPDLAVYGAFVVEDIAGERLDTNSGKHFGLLVHGPDKASLAKALRQRAAYYRDRDPAIARESIERWRELHRDVLAEQNPGDSVTVTFVKGPVILAGDDLDRFELPPEMGWARTWSRWQEDGDSRAALDLAHARADALVEHHRLLVDAGLEDEVTDALEAAASESVDPGLFRKLGELRLRRGDNEGAARAFAVAASDPGVPAAQARVLAGRAGYSVDSPEWRELLDSATAGVLARVLADEVRRPLPPIRVAGGEGERLTFRRILEGKPAVVVFWARWCGPCVAGIPEVVRLAGLVQPLGVRVVSISTDDKPGPEMEAWLQQHLVTYPVYYDLDQEAAGVLGVNTIPAVFVVDADGLVRFEDSSIAAVWRQLEALGLLPSVPNGCDSG